jgi:uncharacterized protein (DUF2237 family)
MMKWVMALNVLGEDLELCDADPLTGFYRDGCRNTGADDVGVHVACAQMTDEFLEFSKANGNDLSTPHPDGGFAGLVAGDRWCVCASRWKDAFDAGVVPPVVLAATHASVLEWVELGELRQHATS